MRAQQILDASRQKAKILELERDREHREFESSMQEKEGRRADLIRMLRPAAAKDYHRWLLGYLENGGSLSHVYDYPFSRWAWYVAATREIVPVPLYGAMAINIIVPVGVLVQEGDWGHCNLFFMDGYKPTMFVPVFSDTNFL